MVFTAMGHRTTGCKCFGGIVSILTSVTTVVLMMYGFVTSYLHPGRVCSGDFLEGAEPEYKDTDKFRYWIGYGMALRLTLVA